MPLEDRDAAYLWDMLQAAKEAVEIMAEHNLTAFLEDRVLQRATERIVDIIGETARRVSPVGQQTTPEIPWRKIVGQRNILAHEYGQIDHELLYKTVVEDIPELVDQLEKVLPPV